MEVSPRQTAGKQHLPRSRVGGPARAPSGEQNRKQLWRLQKEARGSRKGEAGRKASSAENAAGVFIRGIPRRRCGVPSTGLFALTHTRHPKPGLNGQCEEGAQLSVFLVSS